MKDDDDVRFAEIGRAVVEYLHPGSKPAAREATPALVVAAIRRRDDERHSLEISQALRVGRYAMGLWDSLQRERP